MLEADLHTHSHFSSCGLHSFVELLTCARDKGVKVLAITDHGPLIQGRLNSVFFERLHEPVGGVTLLKGIECNLGEEKGSIDAPVHLMPLCDVILVGIHPNTPKGLSERHYTDLLIAAMERNCCIDIITHPNSVECPVDFTRLARAARELDIALELNNSKVALQRVGNNVTARLIDACADEGCPVAVCSDAHALDEVGCDEAIMALVARSGLDRGAIVNRSAISALEWLNRRRARKHRWVHTRNLPG